MRSWKICFESLLLVTLMGLSTQLMAVPPEPVKDLKVSEDNQIRLSWTVPKGNPSGYEIKYSSKADITYDFLYSEAVKYDQAWIPLSPGKRETKILTGFDPNRTYWFSIKSCNKSLEWSGLSNSKTNSAKAREYNPVTQAKGDEDSSWEEEGWEEDKEVEIIEPKDYREGEKYFKNKEYINSFSKFLAVVDKNENDKYVTESNKYIEKIIKKMRKTVESNNSEKEKQYAGGLLHYINEEYNQCLKNWNAFLKQEPGNAEVRVYSESVGIIVKKNLEVKIANLYVKAKRLFAEKEYARAKKIVDALLKADPLNKEVRLLSDKIIREMKAGKPKK